MAKLENGRSIGQGIFEQGRAELVDFQDSSLRALRFLLLDKDGKDHFRREDIDSIARAAIEHPSKIQLVDFVDQIGLPQEIAATIHRQQDVLVPDQRRPFLERYKRAVANKPSVPENISRARLNPFTQFENQPPLLFGMGGGSSGLNKGFPIDILSMVLTAEKLRQEIGLGKCRVICANEITYTNIPKKPDEFSKESIDRVLATERDLLKLVVDKFGIGDHWEIFLESDIEQIIGRDLKDEYDRIVADADTVPFIGGHHYAMEMAQMYTLINQEQGGVKLGWYMRPLNTVRPEYIMDEQPFDARYTLYLAHKGLTNRVSTPYAHAGVKLYPGKKGLVDKEPPYICYDPSNRILLSPFEDPRAKLSEATQAGGGLWFREIKTHYANIVGLFQEIVLGKDFLPTRVPVVNVVEGVGRREKRRMARVSQDQGREYVTKPVYRARTIDEVQNLSGNDPGAMGRKLQFILDHIFDGNREEAKKIYREAFPKAHNYK